MKTQPLIIIALLLGLFVTSCCKHDMYVSPSAEVTASEKSFSDFKRLDISDAFNVEVTFSDTEEKVVIETNSNLHQHIRVFKDHDWLVVELEDNINIRGGDAVLNVYVTMRELDWIKGSGATSFRFQNEMVGDVLDVNLTGASVLTGNINVNRLNATITGSTNLNIDGSAETFMIDATGASKVEHYDFETERLEADLTGASNIYLTIHEEIIVRATGASSIYYRGDAQIKSQQLTGGSRIVKVD